MKKNVIYLSLLLTCSLVLAGCAKNAQPTKNLQDSFYETETEETTPAETQDNDPMPEETTPAAEPDSPMEDPLPSALYQLDQPMQLSDETALTLRLYGKELASGYGISQMDVLEGETLLQTILLADFLSENNEEIPGGEAGFTYTSAKDGCLRLMDMNFDGIPDLGLCVNDFDKNVPYYFWLWDDASRQFVYGFRIPDPVADSEDHLILCKYTDESGNTVTDHYRFEEDKTLSWAAREIAFTDQDGREHIDSFLVQNGELLPDFKVTPLNEVMYAQSDANVRSGFSTDYDKLGRLKQNDKVQITGRCENGWYQISYEGQTAYIAASNLGKEPVVPKQPETPDQQNTDSQPQPTPQQPSVQPQTPAQPANGPYYIDDNAWSVLAIVNQKRAEAGLAALTMNETLISAAKVRDAEISQSFSHTRPDGSACFTAFNVSYSTAGENIAAGQQSPEQVMDSWMNSEGHKANILSPNFTQIAIACYYVPGDAYGYYWVQLFIG